MVNILNHEDFESQTSAAMASHFLWKKRLAEAIDTGESEWTPDFVRSCNNCQFGQWLETIPDDLRDAMYESVDKLHREFHLAAAEVLELALAGSQKEARGRTAINSDFAKASMYLVQALGEWRSSQSGES